MSALRALIKIYLLFEPLIRIKQSSGARFIFHDKISSLILAGSSAENGGSVAKKLTAWFGAPDFCRAKMNFHFTTKTILIYEKQLGKNQVLKAKRR
ncbi:MAG: hypothetical protein H6574_22650 [Lewinellaceae bacterium]|nr:hypothetical protein [Lewinellaceae bacterium]